MKSLIRNNLDYHGKGREEKRRREEENYMNKKMCIITIGIGVLAGSIVLLIIVYLRSTITVSGQFTSTKNRWVEMAFEMPIEIALIRIDEAVYHECLQRILNFKEETPDGLRGYHQLGSFAAMARQESRYVKYVVRTQSNLTKPFALRVKRGYYLVAIWEKGGVYCACHHLIEPSVVNLEQDHLYGMTFSDGASCSSRELR